VAIVAAIAALTPAATAARPHALVSPWSTARAIDQVPPLTQPFTGEASCVSRSLCVVAGVDAVATSTDPAGGPGAWHTTLLPGPVRMTTVSCPSFGECIASFGFARLDVSTDPTGGPRAWRTVRLPSAVTEVNDLDCAAARMCVLVGSGRRVAWSTSPTHGRGAWRVGRVRGADDLLTVSCPSAGLCLAAGDDGDLAVSTDPLGGARTWHVVALHIASTSLGVTCPSTRLCVGSDGQDRLLVSTDPAGGRRAWRRVTLIDRGQGDLDVPVCPTASFCIVGDGRGTVWTSTNPAGGARAWHRHRADFPAGLLACAGRRACVAGDQGGQVAATSDPLHPSRWRRLFRTGGNDLKAVACPSRSLCVAGDDAGNLVTGAGPRAGRWRATGFAQALHHRYRGGEQVLGVACATTTSCLATVTAADDEGDAGQLYAFDPRQVASTLRSVVARASRTRAPEYLSHLACPMRSLCEVEDNVASGRAVPLTSSDPTDSGSWVAATGSEPPPRSACPTSVLCLAPAGNGRVAVFAKGATGFVRTRTLKVLFPGPVDQVSCDHGSACVAVGPGGVAVTDDPTSTRAWHFAASEPLGLLPLSAACPAPSACIAVGLYGKAVWTVRP
jgi:hypothetical protein